MGYKYKDNYKEILKKYGYTYIDGDLVEIATYDRDENEFNLLSRFENE